MFFSQSCYFHFHAAVTVPTVGSLPPAIRFAAGAVAELAVAAAAVELAAAVEAAAGAVEVVVGNKPSV